MPSTSEILAVVMGGGRGERLQPLTKVRSKPAVPIAGRYRLIDIPISNSINSGIYHIAVLTQYNSVSLHRHISQTYRFDDFHKGWVQIWAAEQTLESATWYQGTADAVRKQLFEIRATGAQYVLILAGDHLYRMDYEKMARFHWEHQAEITVAVHPVPRREAHRLGILKCEADGRITDFVEKPQDEGTKDYLVSREDPERPLLGSMGIYLFNLNILIDVLTYHPSHDDFGTNILPEVIHSHRVFGYGFDGYWRDIGTIRAFYETNLQMTTQDAPFNFYDPELPIYTNARSLPGSVVTDSLLADVLLSEGCRIEKAEITHSVVGIRSQVSAGSHIKDCILMGSDYYAPDLGVGKDCIIEGAILDKNVRIGDGCVIRPFPRGTEIDRGDVVVKDGIVVLVKDAVIPPGTLIVPDQ